MTITWNPWFFDLSMDYLLDDWENYKDWRINFYCSANLNLMISACSGNDISTHKCWKSCRYSYWNMVRRWHIPQFTHGAKGNYKCAICIPYFKWGILHNDPHSVACLRKTTIKVILEGTAELQFSELVQVHVHSVSKCYKVAWAFWKDQKIEKSKEKPLSLKEGEQKGRLLISILEMVMVTTLESLQPDSQNMTVSCSYL